jgi:molybdenum cofactor guanylyltransferase
MALADGDRAIDDASDALLRTTTLAILAGGQAARMGKPKSEIIIAGQPILSYLLDRIGWPGPTMLVTAPGREHPPGWQQFSVEAADPVAQGPLGGILTALQIASTPLVAVLTVDMPCVHTKLVRWMIASLQERPAPLGLMLHRELLGARQVEPFPSIYRRQASEAIERRLKQNRRSVQGLLEDPQFLSLSAPADLEQHVWTNLNHPHELADFLGQVDIA